MIEIINISPCEAARCASRAVSAKLEASAVHQENSMSALIVSKHLPEPAGASPQGAAWQQLLHWQESSQQLAFVYSRSQGGLVHTGQGKLDQLSLDATTIEAGASKLYIVLAGASYEAGPQLFFTPNLLSRFHVNGVAVRLANHDWLFLSDESLPTLGMETLIRRLET
jgi:hypothetical protein